MEAALSTATGVAWLLFWWAYLICVATFVRIFSWFFSMLSSLLLFCWSKFTKFVKISFVSDVGRTKRSGGGRGTSSVHEGGGARSVTFIFAEGRASVVATRTTFLSFPSRFTGLRIGTVRPWKIRVAGRHSCMVKEWPVVVLQRVPAIASKDGAVIVNCYGGGTCN